MTHTWAVSQTFATCGFCGVSLKGKPRQIVALAGSSATLLRCLDHALGVIEWDAVQAAKATFDAEQAERADRQAGDEDEDPFA